MRSEISLHVPEKFHRIRDLEGVPGNLPSLQDRERFDASLRLFTDKEIIMEFLRIIHGMNQHLVVMVEVCASSYEGAVETCMDLL